MNIIYVYQYFGTPAGQWSTRVYEFTRRWVAQGHSVTVLTSPYDKSDIVAQKFIEKQFVDGVELIVINLGDNNQFSKWKRARRSFLFSIFSSYYAIKLKADLIICSSGPITVGLSGLIGKYLGGKKLVFEVRDLWPAGGIEMGLIKSYWLQKLFLWLEAVIYQNSNYIITSSDGQRDDIVRRFPHLNGKISIVYNSCDNHLFGITQEVGAGFKSKPYFLYFGSLGFIHNTLYLIDVAKELKVLNKEITIVIIGEGSDKKKLEELILKFTLTNVSIIGAMAKSKLIPYVQNCVATLFTTLGNAVQDTSSPNKVFDSFAAGKPVIQTTRGWLNELIERNECGLNCDVDHPESMAKAIVKYFENTDFLEKHGQSALHLAKTKFDRDVLAKHYLEILKLL
jgi:glycosyltransferase involved in cell wall biosynthesis